MCRPLLALLLGLVLASNNARALDPLYERTLITLCDALVATQLTDPTSADCGALICPSTNPQVHPRHSRAGEAVYPLAVAWQRTQNPRYRDAAVLLGRWLTRIQQPRGAWGEAWPNHDGWAGTTSDQLLSLAGAYPILRDVLSPADRTAWETSIRSAANFVVESFPAGNINYHPTGAVALLLSAEALGESVPVWLAKTDSLIALTFAEVNADGLLTGEGQGVDPGYNLAQSIGYLALYGRLKGDEAIRDRAADLLRTHAAFVYPNGTIDNSWGTRSFKWTYESGTKTAPGVYFTFALLADKDPAFGPAGLRCLDYLVNQSMQDGLVILGPHAAQHAELTPPCLYSALGRAQSIAMALVYAPADAKTESATPFLAEQKNWFRFLPTVNVAVVRTDRIMATVSAYGAIARYGREFVTRGGSVTNLWFEGFGPQGMAQTSSVSAYRREEDIHMPNVPPLQPLTPRAECVIEGITYSNLFEAEGKMTVTQEPGIVVVTTTGHLRDAKGAAADVSYRLTHRFSADRVTKQWTFDSPHARAIRLVEPFVKSPGLSVVQPSPHRVVLQPAGSTRWAFVLERGPAGSQLSAAENASAYWCPFPGVDAHPLTIQLTTSPGQPTTVETSFGPVSDPKPVN